MQLNTSNMVIQTIPKVKTPEIIQKLHVSLDFKGFLDNCFSQYGDTYFSQSFGNQEILTVSHPEDLKVLFNSTDRVMKAPGAANKLFEPQLGENSVILQDGERHQKQRKLMMPPLHGEGMLAYGEQICELAEQTICALKPGQSFMGRHLTEAITMKIILRVVFGINEGQRFDQLQDLMSTWQAITASPLGAMLLLFPSLQKDWGSMSPWGKYLRLRQKIYDLILLEISERRQQDLGQRSDILSLLMSATYDDGQPMTDTELRDNLLTLLNAGHETTATALAWALYWVHSQAEVGQKVVAELKTADPSDPLSFHQLPYLTAVCQETLRIYPGVMFTFPRQTTKPVNLRGYQVEATTYVTPCIYLTHQREDLYPNPTEFRPERFLERKYSAYEFWPFGAGSRQCLGQVFALFEMKLILATLLLKHQFQLEETHPVVPARRGFLMSPKSGVKLRLVA